MKRILAWLAATVLCLGALAGCEAFPQREDTPTPETRTAKDVAPDITVYTADGKPVSLHSLFGKPIVLNFWASWCPPCKAEMPDFQAAYAQLGEQVHFVMVNLTDGQQETVELASGFIESSGFTFPVYYDTSGTAAYTYRISSIPTTYFIRSDGSIATSQVGMLDAAGLDAALKQIR